MKKKHKSKTKLTKPKRKRIAKKKQRAWSVVLYVEHTYALIADSAEEAVERAKMFLEHNEMGDVIEVENVSVDEMAEE